MLDALFFFLIGLINICVYFGKINLIKNPELNKLLIGNKIRLIFLLFGICLLFLGIFLFGLNIYEKNL